MRLAWVLGVVFVALVEACRGAPAGDPSVATADVELPGVETRGFTPREKHEFSRYVMELGAPCPGIAVPVAQCVLEKRACPACLPAAIAIAKAVREGMARDPVEGLYQQRFDVSSAKSIPIDGSPARGSDGATVTLVEFADFECPFCQHIAPQLDELWEKKKPSLLLVFKFMPLAMHPRGEPAARAAIAAQAQGKFWEMHHQLFANAPRLEDSDLDAYAKAIGMDLGRFHADMQSAVTKARLEADRKLADDVGVKGTPTIFINGRLYDGKGDIADWVDGEIAGRASK
jgi:predicted DsbA family dithiol-disulfide isomerase